MVGVGEMIASAVVKEVVGRLTQAVIDEIALQWGYKGEVQKMVEKMKDLEAAMYDADDKLRRGGPVGKSAGRWLTKLKSVAYDFEDVLDHLDGQRNKTKLGKSFQRIIKPHKMEKVREKLEDLVKERHSLELVACEAPPGGNTNHQTIGVSTGMVGRVKERDNIINLLLSSEAQEDIAIIPIVGLGGVGKTTLAQSVYTNEKVIKFFNFQAWVHVTKEFDLCKIGCTVMEKLNNCPRLRYSNLDFLYDDLKKLATTRYLIVLDDIWEENGSVLEKLKLMLQHGSKGSKIIVTTRNLSVVQKLGIASLAPGRKVWPVSDSSQIILDILSPSESWELMKIKALGGHCDKQSGLERIGRQIAEKCGGLPLVVNALGQVMSQSRNVEDWRNIRDTKVELGLRDEHQNETLECLMLSYYYMVLKYKMCFNYLAAFPKGFVINSDLLMKQWNALGYIHSEYDGKSCINYFLGMSFLQIPGSTSVGSSSMQGKVPPQVIMHDLVHELASIVTAEEFLVLDATDQSKCGQSIYFRHAQLIKYKDQSSVFEHLPRKLRSLHFRNSQEIQFPKKAFSRFKYMRILDLSSPQRVGCSTMPPFSIDELKLLRYFDISGLSIESLPKSLHTLENMQTLIISNCSLVTLPDNICSLHKLCYLDLSGNRSLDKLPTSLGKLSKLSFLNVSGCSVLQELPESIYELQCLQHLDLSECRSIQNLPDKFGSLSNLFLLNMSGCSKLTKLPNIVSLKVLEHLNLSGCHELENLPQDFGNLESLGFLNLSDCYKVSMLPESFCKLIQLKVLNLSNCHDLKELPDRFGNLSELDSLNLSDCYKVSVLPETFCKLIQLKDLNLSDCHDLKQLPKKIGQLTELESLNLTSCSKLKLLPDSLCNMFKLRHLNLSYCISLEELPSSFSNLKLHILDISCATALIGLPDGMDNMTSLNQLEVMTGNKKVWETAEAIKKNLELPTRIRHIVQETESEICSSIVELEHLACHELEVVKLQNVKDPEDAERVKLHENTDLRWLSLKWGCVEEDIPVIGWEAFLSSFIQPDRRPQGEKDKPVLERLVPPRGLAQFILQGYLSKDFPNWMCDISSYLPSLTMLGICGLACDTLPPFGRLPNLRRLYLGDSPNIRKIGREFYGDGGICTKLRVISLSSMENLEEWWTTQSGTENEEFLIPNVHSLSLVACPKLKFLPYPPRSITWDLDRSDESFPEGGFGDILSFVVPFQMEMRNCNFSPSKWRGLQHFPSIEILTVESCSSLKKLPEVMQCLTSLTALRLMSLEKLEALPDCLGSLTSLKEVSITDCPNLTYLPESMKNLTALRLVWLKKCKGLHELPEGIGQLTSLQQLFIILCPNLTSLPGSIQNLTALKKLYIEDCPTLVKRCQEEDAHKISHIPDVTLHNNREAIALSALMSLLNELAGRGSTSGDAGASTSRDPTRRN